MLFLSFNTICCMQHNTLKRKTFNVFNNIFWPKLLAIVPINLFFIWRKSFFLVKFIHVCCCVQVKFPLLNQFRMNNFFHIRLDIFSKYIYKRISFIIVLRWWILCVHKDNRWLCFSKYYQKKGLRCSTPLRFF